MPLPPAYSDAQFNLGVMYKKGQGVALDFSKAVTWYKRAAAQGNAKAQFNLGGMYRWAEGVFQKLSKALNY